MTEHPLPASHDDEQHRRRAAWLWLAVVAVLLAGLLTAIERLNGCGHDTCGASSNGASASGGRLPAGHRTAAQSTSGQRANARPAAIQVSGTERRNLAPGLSSPVVISVKNLGESASRITSARIAVGNASKACTAATSIRVTHYDASRPGVPRYELAPGAAVKIPLTITMLDLATNQNACKHASFPLTFHVTTQQG